MRDISNFGNNLRDEIIEYRLEHETGHTLKIKFVDHDDKTTARLCLYSKTGEFLSETDEFPFDPAGQRAIDSIKLIRGSSEGHKAEYEIKVLFRGGKDPVFCPVDDILATLRKELSNKITIDLDNSGEDESSVITSKIYNTSGKELSEDHFSLDNIKMTAQNISMIADAESEEAEPTIVFESDVNDKKVTVYDLDVDNSININKAKIDALEVTGDVKLGTHENSTVQPELAINTTAEFPGVAIEHTLSVKSTASFGNDVNVSGNITVESGTVSSPIMKAVNTFSVGQNSVEYLKVDAIGITARGNTSLVSGDREVSLTENDFTINSMGESETSVTNKKYVNDLVNAERERAIEEENTISSSLNIETTELRRAIEQEISDREEAVTAEKARAENKENKLEERLAAEETRAKAKEREISSNLTTETTRASEAESALDEKITTNVNSINDLSDRLDEESTRAAAAESTLTTNLETEVTRATNKENELTNAIETEVNRADAAEKANAAAIDAEELRASTAETTLAGRLNVIEGEGEGSIKSAVNAEKTRATEAESTLTNNLTAEASAREQGDTELETSIGTTNSNLEKAKKDLNNLIKDEKNRAIGEETKLSNSISSLSTLISNEKRDRESAINQEVIDRTAAINAVSESLGQEVTNREEAITQEHNRAVEAEGQLQGKITSEITRATGVEEEIKLDLATYAKSLELVGGKDTNYKYAFKLKDSKGTILNEYLIDLPIESVVVSGRYDAGNKNVILTLDNGDEISFSVADLIEGLVSDATFNEHVNNINNPHGVTAAQVGLGNVDNTSDLNKPISTATQLALDDKVDKIEGKGLSTNDYDDAAVEKVAKIANKVDKVEGKSLIDNREIERLAGMSDGANKVEKSATNGNIVIDGKEAVVYVEAEYVVHDKDYRHVSVSASEGVTSNNVTYKYDDTALSNSIEAAKTDISELKTRLNSLDDVTISKLVRLVSNLNDNQIDALVAFAQSLKVENVE